jgi:hypothetical protein
MISKRLASGQAVLAPTEAALEVVGSEGLRTLMVASRELEESYFADWTRRYEEASRLLDGRKEAQVGGEKRNRFLFFFF